MSNFTALIRLEPNAEVLISSAAAASHNSIINDPLTMDTDGDPGVLEGAKRPGVAYEVGMLDALVESATTAMSGRSGLTTVGDPPGVIAHVADPVPITAAG